MGRATLIDEQVQENVEGNEVDELDTQDTTAEVEQVTEQETEAPPEQIDLPDKYKGKSLEDLAKMHMEAEKLLGRHSQEVGELRRVVDDFITNQSNAQAKTKDNDEEEVDFFVEPEKAVDRFINNHPKFKEIENYTKTQKQQSARAILANKHPDKEEIAADSKFQEWIQASNIRQQLFIDANQNYNVEAADELLTNWKERQKIIKQTAEVERQGRKQSAKAAQTGSKGSAQTGNRKKVYRRADIIKLMTQDPDRYKALSNEIFQAYAEGRVR